MKEYAIIVAGGKGKRMQSDMPKQFLPLNGKPILLHAIEAFFHYSKEITVILVLPEGDFSIWYSIVDKYSFNHPVILQEGGDTRFQSVKNGLEKIEGEGLVAVHDGVRPLVTTEIIRSSFKLAATHKTAVTVVPLKESIRETDQNKSWSVDRSHYVIVQTPQTFDVGLLKQAYQMKEDASFTDDASVVERSGQPIYLFEGNNRNIKITTPEDLIIAEVLYKIHE
jgi:2-C-methyl-D-erythritol 4-phosphate cytidylyltransferase